MAGTYHVETPERGVLECSLRGRVKARTGERVSVGDRVRVEPLEEGEGRILELIPRRSVLARHGVARRRQQVIAANVDQVAAVVSLRNPEPDFSMVDRLLVLAEINALLGFVVLNKADLRQSNVPGSDGVVSEADFAPYRQAGYPVLETSARDGRGLGALENRLRGRTTAFAGPSGVGKSSLLNALVPDVRLRVGEVGERRGRGRHTTVAARLIPFPGGGYVVDTPGLQVLALWEVEEREVAHAFPEIRAVGDGCRFGDCRHDREPGCAVRAAVETGEISRRRYESYDSLRREAAEGRR